MTQVHVPHPLGAVTMGLITLGIKDAARALGISAAHLRNHLSEVPHFHLGGRVLFPVQELHEWAKRRSEQERRQGEREADGIVRSLGMNDG